MSVLKNVGICLSLLAAGVILTVSLLQTSASAVSAHSPSSTSQLRFGSDIIPGHILYPAVVVKDKLALMAMSKTDQCQRQMEIADKRLAAARLLFEQGDLSASVNTFVKGYNYLAQTALTIQNFDQVPVELQKQLIFEIKTYQSEIKNRKDKFSDTDRVMLDEVLAESEAVIKHLEGSASAVLQ